MPEHKLCVIEVGLHPGPFWFDKLSGIIVCARHRKHYEESEEEYGPFDWEAAEYACEWAGGILACTNRVQGFVDDGDLGEHPLCWNHLNPDQHPPTVKSKLHPLEPVISPCEHAKVINKKITIE
jgi:hypothetical protein